MKGDWFTVHSFVVVHGPEAAGGYVEVAGAVVVEAEVGVELLACEEKFVGRGGDRCSAWRNAGGGRVDDVAEGVVVVGVGDRAIRIGECARAAVAVVDLEPRFSPEPSAV